jgi:hypothetical protein
LEKELSNLFADNPAEENYRLLLPLQIAHRKGTKPTATDLQTLADIANQCPYQGGDGVYEARVMLQAATDSLIDYDNVCDKYNAQVANAGNNINFVKKQENIELFNYGNTLTAYHKDNYLLELTLYDMQGKLLHSQQNKFCNLNLSSYAQGVYFIKIYCPETDEVLQTKTPVLK